MKRILAVLAALVAALVVVAPAQASLTPDEAAYAIYQNQAGWSSLYVASQWQAIGVTHCPPGSNPCWSENSGYTYSNPNQTGPNTVWATVNFFSAIWPDPCHRLFRDQIRAKAYKPASTISVTD